MAIQPNLIALRARSKRGVRKARCANERAPQLLGCIPRPEILDQPQQHPRAGVDIGEFDMFVGVMADAAAAAHENHADIGDIDHGHAIMPCPARQFEHAKALTRNCFRQLGLEPRRARHGAVLVGCVATVVAAAWECDLDRGKARQVLDRAELVDVTAG